jgi:phage terminase large subunit-like protein
LRDFPAIAAEYIARVLSGEEMVCRLNRLAVERHLKDLEKSKSAEYPYYWDTKPGIRFCRLFEYVTPSKWPGKMVMAPWQVAHDMILYGWKHKKPVQYGTDSKGQPILVYPRRFRVAYDRWPRKTGKSARASVQAVFHLKYDSEKGAEVYSAALVEEQARRVFDEAVAMRDATPELRKGIAKQGDSPCRRLRVPATKSEFRPLSRDKESMEGLNISFAVGDEVHKWPGRGAFDVLRYGMRTRVQPLFQLITTAPASDDTTSICNMLDNKAEQVLTGAVDDPTFFAWILEIDGEIKNAAGEVIQEADRWDDETTWHKACPNLGITIKIEDMRQECLEAKNDAESLHAFKRYSLNIRVGGLEQAIQVADWDLCQRSEWDEIGDRVLPAQLRQEALKRLEGRICFAALDLALTDDTSGLALVFPPMEEGEHFEVIPFFWIPADNINERVIKHQVPYDVWRDQGFLVTTPGKVTDYDFIVGDILNLNQRYDLRELSYDPALATGLIQKVIQGRDQPYDGKSAVPQGWTVRGDKIVQKGMKQDKLVKFQQTMMNYAAPCGDFVRAIARREIRHNAEPIMRWQISNLRWIKNHTGLIMPDKLKSVDKIDGVAAAIMAYGRATHPDNAKLFKKPKVSIL